MGSDARVPAVADPTMMRAGIEDTDSVLKLIGNERKENQMKFRPAAVYSQIHILHRPACVFRDWFFRNNAMPQIMKWTDRPRLTSKSP
jgi:hypothetical protein